MMKLFFRCLFIVFIIYGCDPVEYLESVIENKTSVDLKIYYVSKINESNLIDNTTVERIPSMTSVISPRAGGLGYVSIKFVDIDSIYFTDSSNKLLKVYKEDSPGKNMINVDKYWKKEELSKNFFRYTYTINEEDIR